MGGLVLKEPFLLNGKLEHTLRVRLFSLTASSIASSDFVHYSIITPAPFLAPTGIFHTTPLRFLLGVLTANLDTSSESRS